MCTFSQKVTSSLLRRTFPLREIVVPSTAPIHEGYAPHHAIPLWGGRDLSIYLMMKLIEREFSFTSTAEREVTLGRGSRDTSFQYIMKCDVYIRKVQYASLVLSSATNDVTTQSPNRSTNEKTYVFPDENIVIVCVVRFHCGDVRYQSSFTVKRRWPVL